MRTQFICLAFAVILVCSQSRSQWVQTPLDCSTLRFAISGTNIFAGSLQRGVFLSTDNGSTWTQTAFDGSSIFALAARGTNLYCGIDDSVFLSIDTGRTWSPLNGGFSSFSESRAIMALAAGELNVFAGINGQAYHDSSGVFVSTDNGTSWTSILTVMYYPLSALAVSDTRVFVGYAGGQGTGGVHISTDNGESWTLSSLPDAIASAFAFSGTNIFMGTYRGVFLSTDNGSSWIEADSGLTDNDVQALTVSGTNLFAGTLGGVFLSTNNGTSWTEVNEGLPRASGDTTRYATIQCIASSGQHLYAGTGKGVWRRPLAEMIHPVGLKLAVVPFQFGLNQNYPNPFNPSTTIEYDLPAASQVKLSVYDILGREVSLLVNEKKNAGVHEVKFDGGGLSSGVYLYKIQAGDFVQTRKSLLVR